MGSVLSLSLSQLSLCYNAGTALAMVDPMRSRHPILNPLRISMAAVTLFVVPPPVRAETAPKTVIVLDGSGSMGGPLEGQKEIKFDSASKAIMDLLPQAAAGTRTGLVTFGNHRRNDCSDVETPVTPAAGNLDQFKTVFSKIGPVGRGPMVLGLQEALKSFPPGTSGTLIVIHDGIDNCRQDVCAAAAEIAKSNPELVIHSIPISLDKTVAERMACVAQLSGGRVFEARDGAAVMSGLKEALTLAKILGANEVVAAPVVPLPIANDGPPILRLSASLAKGGPPLTGAVTWRVKSSAAPDAIVKEGKVPVLAAEVPEGRYTVEASYGLSKVETTIDVGPKGPTVAQVALNAGTLIVSSLTAKSAASATDPSIIVSALKDTPGVLTPIFVGRETNAELVLPAGRYRIEAGDGLAVKTEDVVVEPGATVTPDMAVNAGRLQLSAISHDGGGPIDGATFVISTDDPDAPNGKREITRSSASAPEFMLPAGTYYLTVKVGGSETKERVAISTGDVLKRAIILNGAWVGLTTTHDGSLVPNGAPVMFRVFPKDAAKDRQAISIASERTETGGSPANVFLPFGSYRIEASLGRQNVKGDSLIDIAAGSPAVVPVNVVISQVIVRPPSDASSAAGLYWELRDSRGHIVHRSAGAMSEKALLMAPGSYVLRSQTGDMSKDLRLDLKPGDTRAISMPLD